MNRVIERYYDEDKLTARMMELDYGKGYYDRFLDKFIGVTVGVCYDTCISDSLPRDQFDKKVNYLITNTKIYDLR